MELDGRVAVVTGGASGLGRATATELVAHGALVAVVDNDGASAESLSAQLGPRAVAIEADVSDAESVGAAMDLVDRSFGRVEICLNAAGTSSAAKLLGGATELSLAEFRRVVDVNLVGTFEVMRQCARRMAANEPGADGERGVIVNVASVAALQGQVGQAAYAASKAGVLGLMLPAARDLAPFGVRVVTIAPGVFDTEMASAVPTKARQRMLDGVLTPRRIGHPHEFAALVVHVLQNAYLNAAHLPIDGGLRLA